MRQNPKTKMKVSDSSPVMHCRAIRRRKMNGSADSKAWGVDAAPRKDISAGRSE